MSDWRIWQYRISRALGRLAIRVAAMLTLERMPPFISTSAIVTNGDQLLVVVDSIKGEPVLPGGHLKWRESPEAAIVREVREETGYQIALHELLGLFAGEKWSGERGIVRVVYTAAVESGTLHSSPEGEAQWMPLAEIVASETRDALMLQYWLERQTARPLR